MADTQSNFFILLDINPDEQWDDLKIKEVIQRKRQEWTKQSQHPTKGAVARQSLQKIPEIERVMLDPAQRETQAKAAREALKAGKQAILERFEKDLAYINVKDTITQSELDKLIKDYKDVLPESEIRKRVKPRLVADPMATAATTTLTQQLDPSLFKTIAERLAFLHLASLYDLLGIGDKVATSLLKDKARELYDEMNKRPKEEVVSAKSELAGHAINIFQSDEMRKRYDESRRQSTLTQLLNELAENVQRAGNNEVHEKQVALFLETARKAGWSNDEAQARLNDYARQRKWSLRIPVFDQSVQEQQRCGYCNELNEKGRNFCRSCNRELSINCPNCGRRAVSDEIGCGACGFPIGNRYYVDELLTRLPLAQDVQQAQTLLREAEQVWRPNKPDARAQHIAQLKQEVERKLQEQRQLLVELQRLMQQKQFFAARQYLITNAAHLVNADQHQRTVSATIAQAQDLLKRAQVRTLGREERVDLCRQALRLCADYKDARDLLSTMPPDAPHNLRARIGGMLVSLAWDASPTPATSYRIVRKSGAQLVSAADGTTLATSAGCVYDDTTPEIGVPLYYAIYAECEGVISLQGALLNAPLLLIDDVQQETAEVNDRQIRLTWQLPAHTQNVIVVRKERERPRSSSDGQVIPLLSMTQVIDRDVANEHVYYYGVYCQFRDQQGRLITSPGKILQAVPEQPPEAITQLDIASTKTDKGYLVELRWAKPAKGKVAILKSEQLPTCKVGEVLPVSQLGHYGKLLEGQADRLTDPWTTSGIGYYTPIVLFGSMAYIGATQRFTSLDDVSDLRCEMLGVALRLLWKWPAGCQETIIAYSNERWPRPGETGLVTQRLTRAQYESRGHFDITGISERDYYIVVAAIVRQGNEELIGSGARVQARLMSKISITYEIKQARFGRKRRTLHIYTRKAGTLPSFLLVTRQGRLPLHKSEGEPFYRQTGPIEIEQELVFELPDQALPPKTLSKLYLEDDSAYEYVSIHHPSEEKLRLG